MSESHLRIIPRLDIKAPNLVKGVRLEGFRVLGSPSERAAMYYEDGADELFYQDIVASLYQRNSLLDLVEETAGTLFVPLLVGGGLRSVEDIREILRVGADRVALNTAIVERPEFIAEAAEIFGSQCIAATMEVIRHGPGRWEILTDCGRERTGLDALEWIGQCVDLGAGEIVLTSVDRDGTKKGFDIELLAATLARVQVPVVIHGGAGTVDHIIAAASEGASGVVLATMLHYETSSVSQVKRELSEAGVAVRT